MRSNKSYVKETLAFVNKIRSQFDAEPLADLACGKQNGGCCPVSSSLETDGKLRPYTCASLGHPDNDDQTYVWVGPLIDRRKIPQTRAVRRFVRAFDTGRLPEYHI